MGGGGNRGLRGQHSLGGPSGGCSPLNSQICSEFVYNSKGPKIKRNFCRRNIYVKTTWVWGIGWDFFKKKLWVCFFCVFIELLLIPGAASLLLLINVTKNILKCQDNRDPYPRRVRPYLDVLSTPHQCVSDPTSIIPSHSYKDIPFHFSNKIYVCLN